PNVAGWPGGQSWIDSSTLLTRLQLPRVVLGNENLDLRVKDNGDDNEEKIQRKEGFTVKMNWEAFARTFENYPDHALPQVLASY
ncbi:MAG: DUF1800 domain-containing protein, partial [Runella slithyformis]